MDDEKMMKSCQLILEKLKDREKESECMDEWVGSLSCYVATTIFIQDNPKEAVHDFFSAVLDKLEFLEKEKINSYQ